MNSLFGREGNQVKIEDGELFFYPDFLDIDQASFYFKHFMSNTPWQSDDIKIFGKVHPIPRLQAWYGDKGAKYSYSNIDLEPLQWTEVLSKLKSQVEEFANTKFNSVLLNLYRDGRDSNGWHSDDEKELGKQPEIASVSLGQDRIFHMKHRTKKLKTKIVLEHGSLLIMGGATQENWKHQIPKSAKPMEPRINLTFRKIFH